MDIISDWISGNMLGIGVFVGVLLVFYVFKIAGLAYLKRLAERTVVDIDDFVIDILKTFKLFFAVVVSFVAALLVQGYDVFENRFFAVLILAVLTHQVVSTVGVIFEYSVKKFGVGDARSVYGLKTVIEIFVWSIGILSVMTVLGFNISSIIAGLGIGGLAIALAVQNVLEDIFSSFAIYFDRPFAVGDYISIGDDGGVVERIGMKSTRIRSLRGEEIVMSNKVLTDKNILNFGRLKRRRVLTSLGFVYSTPNEKLEKIADQMKIIVKSQEGTDFERVYFKEFGDSGLIYEMSYYVNTSVFNDFARVKNAINLDMKKWFESEGIEFAYPTQTVFVENNA